MESSSERDEGMYLGVLPDPFTKKFTPVAVKTVPLDTWEGVSGYWLRQISLLQSLNHPNIIKLLAVQTDEEGFLSLMFEFVPLSLDRYLRSITSIPVSTLKKFIYQLLLGLTHCHERGIAHRNLKPRHILLDPSGQVKISSFTLSRAMQTYLTDNTPEVVSLWYRAPEILLGGRYSLEVDVWSLGCIFAEITTGEPLFEGDSEIGQLVKIFQVLGTPTEELWQGVSKYSQYANTFPKWGPKRLSTVLPHLGPLSLDLLSKMLHYDPKRRITARDALRHPFFHDLQQLCMQLASSKREDESEAGNKIPPSNTDNQSVHA